jgi:hypothetical protein
MSRRNIWELRRRFSASGAVTAPSAAPSNAASLSVLIPVQVLTSPRCLWGHAEEFVPKPRAFWIW